MFFTTKINKLSWLTLCSALNFFACAKDNDAKNGDFEPTAADLTPPSAAANLQGVLGEQTVTLAWTNPSDEDFSGVMVLRVAGSESDGTPEKDASYEVGTALGQSMIIFIGDHTNTGITDGTLVPGVYTYVIWTHDHVGNWQGSASLTMTIPEQTEGAPDKTPPAPVANVKSAVKKHTIDFSWVNPKDLDFAGVVLTRTAEGAQNGTPQPGTTYTLGARLADSVIIYVGNEKNSQATDNSPVVGTFVYHIWGHDKVRNWSSAESKKRQFPDVTPPRLVVSSLTAKQISTLQTYVGWSVPNDEDYSYVRVVRTAATGDTEIYKGQSSTYLYDSLNQEAIHGAVIKYTVYTCDAADNCMTQGVEKIVTVDLVAPNLVKQNFPTGELAWDSVYVDVDLEFDEGIYFNSDNFSVKHPGIKVDTAFIVRGSKKIKFRLMHLNPGSTYSINLDKTFYDVANNNLVLVGPFAVKIATGPTLETKRIFITSQRVTGKISEGSLVGLPAADAKCQAEATVANLGGTWIAYLSTSFVNAIDRIETAARWVLAKDTTQLAFAHKKEMIYGPRVRITLDAMGNKHLGYVWSGTGHGTGKVYSAQHPNSTISPFTCNDWTDDTRNLVGGVGFSDHTTGTVFPNGRGISASGWSDFSAGYCEGKDLGGAPQAGGFLYCVEK